MKITWTRGKGNLSCQLVLSSALALGFADSVCAQGFISFDTYDNTSTSFTAVSNGQWWLWNMKSYPGSPVLLNQDVNAELWASATGAPGTFTPVAKLLLSDGSARGDITWNSPGQFADPGLLVYSVPGQGPTSYFFIQAWLGNATSLGGALNSYVPLYDGEWNGIFQNPTSRSPDSAPSLTMSPAIVLVLPEPGTFVLAGLGAGALLIFRRRR